MVTYQHDSLGENEMENQCVEHEYLFSSLTSDDTDDYHASMMVLTKWNQLVCEQVLV